MNFNTINLIIDNKNLEFLILNEYDGIKELFNDKENILLSWFNETKDYEEWILLKLNKNDSNLYLRGKISLLKLILKNKIFIVKRYFDDYSKFKDIVKTNLNDIKDGIPIEDMTFDLKPL